MKNLNLTIKKQWFDMIVNGDKKVEYREIKQYWASRLFDYHEPMDEIDTEEMLEDMRCEGAYDFNVSSLLRYYLVNFKEFDTVTFRNGYSKDAPTATFKCLGVTVDTGMMAWGAVIGVNYFCIHLGDRL